MAKGSSFQPDTRDPRLKVPSGALNAGSSGSHSMDRAGAGVISATGGVRSSRPSGGGMPRTYVGSGATNPLARRR